MRKFKLVVVAFIFSLVLMPLVYAECDATESNKLSNAANNVKANFEVIEKEVENTDDFNPPDGLTDEELDAYVFTEKFFRIHVSNITEDIYVIVTNDVTKESKRFNFTDTENGNISFDNMVTSDIINYSINIYSSDKTNCVNKNLRTLPLTTPMYNTLSELSLCEGIEEYYMCHEYLSVGVDFNNFEKLAEQYRKGKEKEEDKKNEEKNKGFFGFIRKNAVLVIITSVGIIAVGGIVTVIIVKRQRSRIV